MEENIHEQKYKNKLLAIIKILKNSKDKNEVFSTYRMIDLMKKMGVGADRRTLNKEISFLIDCGVPISILKEGHHWAYRYEDPFDKEDLMSIIFALKSSSFITEEKTDSLIKKLISIRQGKNENLEDNIITCFNIEKTCCENVFSNILKIQKCIKNRYEMNFHYMNYVCDRNGKVTFERKNKDYRARPISLIYSEGFFYMHTSNQRFKNITTYRVDRIVDINVTPEPVDNKAEEFFKEYIPLENGAVKVENIDEMIKIYAKQSFKMFAGGFNNVGLRFKKSLMNPVFDKFGKPEKNKKNISVSVDKNDNDYLITNVYIQTSPMFWAWVAQFQGDMEIIGPKKCIKEYKTFISNIIELQL